MFIENDVLITWGAVAKKYKKGEFIFNEDEKPYYFFQIISGKVKMFNINFDGKEFAQAEFGDGESFGEPPIFIDEVYPSSAIATENSVILKIKKENFVELLDEYPSLQKKLITLFARRIFNKAVTAKKIINNSPEDRIFSFLTAYKKKTNAVNLQIEIPYTRQEIANFTGLRVETVIRTLNKMQQKNKVKITNRKLVF